ncbi:MAG: PHP domain-containing protein [Clostridia bacterium]|nr:PHP domain-containing protein [Clostridia bacterium]
MSAPLCDLHTHSHYSDGTYSPTEIIEEARRIGLSAVALTDHNTTAGLYEFARAAEGTNIEAICGVELSTDFGERELHIVALYLSPEHYSEVEELVAAMRRRKEAANRTLIEKLRARGIDITYEDASRGARGQLNRAHIAYEMYRKGYAESVADAFARYLDPALKIYEPPLKLDVFETIKFIRKIGAVPVLAHPFYSLGTVENIERFLSMAAPTGLIGIESMYSTHDETMTEAVRALARKYSLIESGGSDFHGEKRPSVSLGTGLGNLRIPASAARALRCGIK